MKRKNEARCQWIKKGNFEIIPNFIYYNKKVAYYNENNQSDLTLYGYPNNTYTIELHISWLKPAPDELFTFYHNLKSKYQDKSNFKYHEAGLWVKLEREENPDVISEFLNEIVNYNALEEIKDEIFDSLGIFHEGKDLNETIKKAIESQQKGNFKPLEQLAKELILTECSKTIVREVYEAVSPENPFYEEAQHAMIFFFQDFSLGNDQRLSKQLHHAYNADNQQLVEQFFYNLKNQPGNKVILPRKDTSSKTYPDILMDAAEEIRHANQEIEKLKRILASKEQEIVNLKKQIESHNTKDWAPNFF